MKVEDSVFPSLMEEPYYISLERFAELIGLSDRLALLEELIQRGEVPVRQFGQQRLVNLQAFLQAHVQRREP